MNDQILTVKEVAEYLKVNERTIYRLATEKKIPAFRVGTSWRFRRAEVDSWINAGGVDSDKPAGLEED
jgi:excisionase family DNA binding protein